jgi:hypothetical protein
MGIATWLADKPFAWYGNGLEKQALEKRTQYKIVFFA